MSKKNKNGMTRQGVRDLSHIKGKSVGIVLEMPPDPNAVEGGCRHQKIDDYGSCRSCGEEVVNYP